MWSQEIRRGRSGLGYRRSGAGRCVVLVHGIPGSGACWRAVVDRLPDDLDVVVPDLLGFGASDRPAGIGTLHASSQAEALSDLLDELDCPTPVVVGHDFGGPVTLMLTARRAVAAVGLLATNVFPDTPIPFPLSTVTWPIVGSLAQRALFSRPSLAMMLRQGTGPGSAAPDRALCLGDRAQSRAIATIFAASLTDLAALYQPVEARLRALAVPTFVGWGDKDPFFTFAQGERTAEACNARLSRYQDAGHFLPEERPVEVAKDIRALVTTVLP